MAFVHPLTAFEVDRRRRFEFIEEYANFEFNNESPYHVLVRFDFDETNWDNPQFVCKPWNTQTVSKANPTDRLMFMAVTRLKGEPLPPAGNPENLVPRFSFQATDRDVTSGPSAYGNVGILSAIQAEVAGEVNTRLENMEEAAGYRVVLVSVAGDTYPRLEVTNTGELRVGDGATAPVSLGRLIGADSLDGYATTTYVLNAPFLGVDADGNVPGDLVVLGSGYELGPQGGVSGPAYVDFHTGSTTSDYNARIIARGGADGINDAGLSYQAAGHDFVGGPLRAGGEEVATESYADSGDATRLPLSGGTMSGVINMGGYTLGNLPLPSSAGHATRKSYVDDGDSATLSNAQNYADQGDADHSNADRNYTDQRVDTRLPLTGGTMSGGLDMGNNSIGRVTNPVGPAQAANKDYVDWAVSAKRSGLGASVTAGFTVVGNFVIQSMGAYRQISGQVYANGFQSAGTVICNVGAANAPANVDRTIACPILDENRNWLNLVIPCRIATDGTISIRRALGDLNTVDLSSLHWLVG